MTTDAERFIARFRSAWVGPDPDAVAALWHEDGTLLHPGIRTPIPRDRIPAHLRRITALMSDLRLSVERWAARGGTVLVEWSLTATVDGDAVSLRGIDRFTVREERAVEAVVYFDTVPLLPLTEDAMSR